MPITENYKLKKDNRYISPSYRRSDTDINRLLILKTNKETERHMKGYNRNEDRKIPQTPEIFRPGARGPFQLYKPEDFGLTETEIFKHPKEVFEGLEYEPRDTPRGILKAARYKKENFQAMPEEDFKTPTISKAAQESLGHLQKEKKTRKEMPEISDKNLSLRKQLLLQQLKELEAYKPRKLDFDDTPSIEIEPDHQAAFERLIYTELPSPSSGEITILDESEMRTDDVFGSDHIGDIDILPKPPDIDILERNEILHDSQMNNDDLFASDNILDPQQVFVNKPSVDSQRVENQNDQKPLDKSIKLPKSFFRSLLYMFQSGTNYLSSSSGNEDKNIENDHHYAQKSVEFPEGEVFLENLEENLNSTLSILLEKDMPFEDIFGKSHVEVPIRIGSITKKHPLEYMDEDEKLEEVSFPQINTSEVGYIDDDRTTSQKREEIKKDADRLDDLQKYIAEIEKNLTSERSLLELNDRKSNKSTNKLQSEQKHTKSLPRSNVVSMQIEKVMSYFEPDSPHLSMLRNRFRILRGLNPEESVILHSQDMTSKALDEESEPLEMASGYYTDHEKSSKKKQDNSFHFKGMSFSDSKQLDQESFPHLSIYSQEELSERQFPNIFKDKTKDDLSIIEIDDLNYEEIFGTSQILSPKIAFGKLRGLNPEESVILHSQDMTSKALDEESEPLEMASGYYTDHEKSSKKKQDNSFHFKGMSFSDSKQLDQESFPHLSIYSQEELSERQFPNIFKDKTKDDLSIIEIDDLNYEDIFGTSQILSPKIAFGKLQSNDINDLRDRFQFLKDFGNELNISSVRNNNNDILYPQTGIPLYSEGHRNLSSESAPFLVENSLPKFYTLPLGKDISKIPKFPRTFSKKSHYPIDGRSTIGRTSILPHEKNFKWLPNYLPFTEQIGEHKVVPQSSVRESRIPRTSRRTPRDLRI